MVLLLAGWSLWANRGLPLRAFSWPEAAAALRAARWELPLPLIVLGGIYGGFFAVSEMAAVTALYVFVVEVLIHREIPFRELPRVMREAMLLVGGVLVILGVSLATTNVLIDAQVPARLFESIQSFVRSELAFLALLNVLLLVLGAILDIFAALVIMVPLLLPVAVGYGIDPVHLGIVFLANMQLGYFTPPVGMNLFIASLRFRRSVLTLCRAAVPFFVVLLFAVLVITYWPGLSLWLTGR